MSSSSSVPLSSSGAADASGEVPVEVASMFYTGINEPRPTSMDFSLDGLHFISSHADDAVRVIDVGGLSHTHTILCDAFGVHKVAYTHTSAVVCVAPRFHRDGHLHLLNVETAQFFSEMAFIDDAWVRDNSVNQLPVYSTLAQCPVSDVVASVMSHQRNLVFFHPLIAGCVAASAVGSVVGPSACVRFSPDGTHVAVGDDTFVLVLDRRHLLGEPLVRKSKDELFTHYPQLSCCTGVDFNADGTHLLITSSLGEVVVYDWRADVVVVNYSHGAARKHFIGAGNAVGARYALPHARHSPILQPTSTMNNGRHLLIYDGAAEAEAKAGAAGASANTPARDKSSAPIKGRLLYELQAKDSDEPVAVAVNPRFRVAATAARSITWWVYNEKLSDVQVPKE